MFNVGFGELIVILLVGFIVVGPRGLPGLARSVARLWKEVRRYADQLSAEVRANMGEIEKELGDVPGEIRKTAAAIDKVSDKISKKVSIRDAFDSEDGEDEPRIGGRRKKAKEPGPAEPPPEPVAVASTEVVTDSDLDTFVTGKTIEPVAGSTEAKKPD